MKMEYAAIMVHTMRSLFTANKCIFLYLFEADLLAVSTPPATTVDSAVSAVSGPTSLVTVTDLSAILIPPVAVADGAVSVVPRAASLSTATASNSGTAPVENFIDDEKACEQFIRNTCGCKKAPNNKPCSSLLSVQHYMDL